jgi:hypothetical protein
MPASQKDRPIGFLLWDAAGGGVEAELAFHIRPEELTKTDPSRITVHQTLGGAWADTFGPGVSQITIRGTTGWRGTASGDGLALFQELRDAVFPRWHGLRAANVEAGRSPDSVELVFYDHLDEVAEVVAPDRFTLRRHKSRPLLAQYEIVMTVLRPVSEQLAMLVADPLVEAIAHPGGRYLAAAPALDGIIARQTGLAGVTGALGALAGPANAILGASAALLAQVQSVAAAGLGVLDAAALPLLQVAQTVQAAARNAFQLLAVPYAAAVHVHALARRIAATFHEAWCLLRTGFDLIGRMPDFSDLLGASGCSSTGGGLPGSPLAGVNPFAAIYASPLAVPAVDAVARPVVDVSLAAGEALRSLARDVLTVPVPVDALAVGAQLRTVAEGITVNLPLPEAVLARVGEALRTRTGELATVWAA